MSFDVTADSYERFMGRYSSPLGDRLLELAPPGVRSLDVGCGTGALTAKLVSLLGSDAVSAVDPSESFVSATAERLPAVDVRRATADTLPYADASFATTYAQLVVHFMPDPVVGIAGMARVTRPGGLVAASVWDHAGDTSPLAAFREVVRSLDPDAPDESRLPGVREGQLAEYFSLAGLADIRSTSISSTVTYASFDEWWEPYTLGVGPAGDYVASLDADAVERLRRACESALPPSPFNVTARAWVAVGTA